MQRARLASIVVIAAVGVLALSGCRSQPGVAAYIGAQQITENQVTGIVDDVKRKIPAGAQATPPTRDAVVSTLVLSDICQRLTAEKGLQPQGKPPADQVAMLLGVPVNSTYAQQRVDLYGCLSGVPAGQPVAPTPQELAAVVARGKAGGVIPPNVPEQVAAQQLDGTQLRAALASRKAIADAVARYAVTVNPRYRPLEFPVLSFQGNVVALSVPLGQGDPGTVVAPR
jgi:hypothetical protein